MDTTRSSSPELPNVGKSDTGSKSETKRDRKRKIITSDEVVAEEISSLEQPSDTVYSCMTLDEKKRLLNVIKTKGFGIIYTPQLLLDEFPGRSKNEISFMIENYKRKGKEFANKLKSSVNIDSNEKTGTEQWYSLIHNLVPHLSKRDDLSDLLIELFHDYGEASNQNRSEEASNQNRFKEASNQNRSEEASNQSRSEEGANYDQIYGFLAEILRGKYPRDLNAFDSLIVLSLLETLRRYSETFDCSEEEEFMKSGAWWKKDEKSQEENHEEESTNSSDTSGAYLITKYFESCLEYPKIRKIKHCFNPMNVPVKMLQKEHEKVSKMLQDENEKFSEMLEKYRQESDESQESES